MSPTLSRPIPNSTAPVTNPLLKKLSLKKPIGAVSSTTTDEKLVAESVTTQQNEESVNPFKKPLSFDKFRETINKEAEPIVDNKENVKLESNETSVEESSTENENTKDTVLETAEVSTDEIVNTESEVADDSTVQSNTVETIENTVESDIEETTDEPVVEETPKKKRTRRSKAQIEADKLNANENEKTETITCDTVTEGITTETHEVRNNSTISFAEAVNVFQSFSADAEWMEYKADIEKAYAAISITPDINSAMLVGIINQLSNLRDRIWNQHQYYKNQYDQLSSKEPEGVIERIKRINVNENANNDMARKKSGIAACMNYKTENGETINLYDLLDEVRARYYFLNAIMSNIEFKKNLLITISSALKIESSLAQ